MDLIIANYQEELFINEQFLFEFWFAFWFWFPHTSHDYRYRKNLLSKSSLRIYFSEELNTFLNSIFQQFQDLQMSQITIDLDDFCSADYATFWILKIWLVVDFIIYGTLPLEKTAIKFTSPPQFLLVPEKWKISKFEPCYWIFWSKLFLLFRPLP